VTVLLDFLPEWTLAMQTAQRSPRTITSYAAGVRAFAAWLAEHAPDVTQPDDVTPSHVRGWLAELTERGAAPKTVGARYQAARALFDWLAREGEVTASPVLRVERPRLVEPEIKVPTLDELRAVLATASDRRSFGDVRDTAVIRLWLDTGLRRSELAALRVSDVDLTAGEASVMGKGRKPRTVAFGRATATALARYVRLRGRHPRADLPDLWLGDRGRGPIDGASLYTMLTRRAERAGVQLHPHQLRHFFADAWLKEGGSEGGLMRAAGWSSRQMLDRYASANAAERSRAERRRLTLGDAL
jgi:site-specific recombinase XerD